MKTASKITLALAALFCAAIFTPRAAEANHYGHSGYSYHSVQHYYHAPVVHHRPVVRRAYCPPPVYRVPVYHRPVHVVPVYRPPVYYHAPVYRSYHPPRHHTRAHLSIRF